MEKEYQIIRLLKRQNKEKNKTYYLALVLFNREYDSDLIRILVKDEQVSKLDNLLKSKQDDITRYIKIEYNSYQKVYQPQITI